MQIYYASTVSLSIYHIRITAVSYTHLDILPKLAKMGTARFLLAHLSHENNTPDIALQTSLCSLTMEGLKRGLDYEIDIAPRENTKHGTILF